MTKKISFHRAGWGYLIKANGKPLDTRFFSDAIMRSEDDPKAWTWNGSRFGYLAEAKATAAYEISHAEAR